VTLRTTSGALDNRPPINERSGYERNEESSLRASLDVNVPFVADARSSWANNNRRIRDNASGQGAITSRKGFLHGIIQNYRRLPANVGEATARERRRLGRSRDKGSLVLPGGPPHRPSGDAVKFSFLQPRYRYLKYTGARRPRRGYEILDKRSAPPGKVSDGQRPGLDATKLRLRR